MGAWGWAARRQFGTDGLCEPYSGRAWRSSISFEFVAMLSLIQFVLWFCLRLLRVSPRSA